MEGFSLGTTYMTSTQLSLTFGGIFLCNGARNLSAEAMWELFLSPST